MLGEFFQWWGQNLWSLLPEQLRQRDGAADALVVDAGTPGLLLVRRRRAGQETTVGRALVERGQLEEQGLAALRAQLNGRPRGERVLLRLAASQVLERQVTLPLAAERDPERVLGFEMERLTPFTAAEVFWGFGVESRDKARGRLALRLTLVPRAAVQGLIDVLTESGGRPNLLEAPVGGFMRAITLTHSEAPTRFSLLDPKNLRWVAAGLAALVVISPVIRQSLDLASVDGQLAELAPRLRVVDALRGRIMGSQAGGDALAQETRRLGDTLGALSAVTDILPDSAYLTEFTMQERKMTLSGLAASAPALISALSADPRVRNPAFTAPVTRSDATHMDVFTIRAELAAP